MMRLKVLIVEDSITIRERLTEVLNADPGFEVIGHAGDGPTALRLYEEKRPDVISLDMVLPGMSGLEVTRRIMATRATPILIVSASVNRGEAFDTFDALQAGAVDVFEKSRMGRGTDWIDSLKNALRLVARIRVVTRPMARPLRGYAETPAIVDRIYDVEPREVSPSVVLLGASTGGPAAIAQILSGLTIDFRLPILVVLHIAPIFSDQLAEWLGRQSGIPVRVATDGEPLPAPQSKAQVILAPPDRHLIVDGGRLRLTLDPERHSCRPSVDVLFESVAASLGPRTIAGLLTGMGRDGAAGLLALRQAHALTFAQDEASCALFGMPREAIQLGAATWILPLSEIASRLHKVSLARSESGVT